MIDKLDKIDIKILKLLQQNSNRTVKNIAEILGLTTTPIFDRIKKLEKKGFIGKYAAILNSKMLGLKLIYMDAGSGAKVPISTDMINGVAGAIDIPLIIGGGIKDPQKAFDNVRAGADVIVVGDAIEKDPSLIVDLSAAVHSFKQDVTKV